MVGNVRDVADEVALAAAASLFGGEPASSVVDGPWAASSAGNGHAEPATLGAVAPPAPASVVHGADPAVLWAKWRPEFERGMGPGFHTADSLERALMAGHVQFWPGERAAIVTQLVDYAGGERTLEVTWQAGDPAEACALLPGAIAWARLQGCNSILIEGRAAWARLLRDHGFEPWSQTVRKVL